MFVVIHLWPNASPTIMPDVFRNYEDARTCAAVCQRNDKPGHSYIAVGGYTCPNCFETNITRLRTLDEWHEDEGPVLWWSFPIQEAPYVGSPLDSDWPDYHTHWTPIAIPEPPLTADDGQFGVGA